MLEGDSMSGAWWCLRMVDDRCTGWLWWIVDNEHPHMICPDSSMLAQLEGAKSREGSGFTPSFCHYTPHSLLGFSPSTGPYNHVIYLELRGTWILGPDQMYHIASPTGLNPPERAKLNCTFLVYSKTHQPYSYKFNHCMATSIKRMIYITAFYRTLSFGTDSAVPDRPQLSTPPSRNVWLAPGHLACEVSFQPDTPGAHPAQQESRDRKLV